MNEWTIKNWWAWSQKSCNFCNRQKSRRSNSSSFDSLDFRCQFDSPFAPTRCRCTWTHPGDCDRHLLHPHRSCWPERAGRFLCTVGCWSMLATASIRRGREWIYWASSSAPQHWSLFQSNLLPFRTLAPMQKCYCALATQGTRRGSPCSHKWVWPIPSNPPHRSDYSAGQMEQRPNSTGVSFSMMSFTGKSFVACDGRIPFCRLRM